MINITFSTSVCKEPEQYQDCIDYEEIQQKLIKNDFFKISPHSNIIAYQITKLFKRSIKKHAELSNINIHYRLQDISKVGNIVAVLSKFTDREISHSIDQ